MKRLGKAFAAILFAGFLFANIAVASAIPLANTNIRTVDEIRAKWTLDKPVYSGSAFLVNPGVTAPYSTGVLQPGYMQDALDKTNFARYLVGLPDDVTLDAAYTDEVQHSAVVLAGIGGSLTHYPVKPADMDQSFFDIGYAGTTSSNIAAGNMALHLTVDVYLSDAGDTNIAVVGHRRWILNPSLAKTGFGWAKKTGSLYNTYSAMHAFDRSRSDVVTYTSYGWPAAGPFPRDFFPDGTPWSIHLDTFDYDYDMTGVVVTLTRVGDGSSWTFNQADHTADTSGSGEYFNIDGPGYGSPACIIFRPPLSLHYNVGDAFDVRVSGKLYTKGTTNPVQLNYRTTFFDLVRPNTAPVAVNDIAVVAQNGQLSVAIPGVLSNDTGGEGDVLSVRLASGVSHGTLLLNSNGSYTYQPSSGYYGTDTFYYYANDGTVDSNMGRVTITVVRGISLPKATVYTPVAPSTMYRGHSYTIYGYVAPRHTSGTYLATLKFYLRNSHGVYVFHNSVNAKRYYYSTTKSKYSARVSLPHAGRWRVRAMHGDAGHSTSYSGYDYITVK